MRKIKFIIGFFFILLILSCELPENKNIDNDAPEFTSNPVTTAQELVTYTYQLEASDKDDDLITFYLTVLPDGMSLDAAGLIEWSPVIDQAGMHDVSVKVEDPDGLFATQSFIIDVAVRDNKAPVANDLNLVGAEDLIINITLTATDEDNEPLTYETVSQPTNGVLTGTVPNLVYSPNMNFFGSDSFTFKANDGIEDSNTATVNMTIASVNDAPSIVSTPSLTAEENVSYSYSMVVTDIDINETFTYSLSTAPTGMTINSTIGSVSWTPSVGQSGNHSVSAVVTDSGGLSDTQDFIISVSAAPIDPEVDLPPDPSTIAPALSTTEVTDFSTANEFLYTGDSPIQTGVVDGTMQDYRVSVIRGTVLDRNNDALSGVTISVKDHSEFGETLSRVDGVFDMAVNGGGLLTVDYIKDGYLPVQRTMKTPWVDYVIVEDVVMIELDSAVATIDLSDTSQSFQIAQGSEQTDDAGTRQATILFPQGTTAEMTLSDGSKVALTTINVRATEYTVGENGAEAMPGDLPATSGYTYAVELSVDEVIAAGASRIDFDKALSVYVDNFLNFPTGEVVPVGWYDFEKSSWIASDNGRVIEILSIDAGVVSIDIDGDGMSDNDIAEAELGITLEELEQLATTWEVGKTLWRVPATHFTAQDYNWPAGPPLNATAPSNEKPKTTDDIKPESEDTDECAGCIINVQSQTLAEEVAVTGTPFMLRYQSDRVIDYKGNRVVTIPLTDDEVSVDLRSIQVDIDIAGQTHIQTYTPESNLTATFEWDGKDAYGRDAKSAEAYIEVSFIYNIVYYSSQKDSAKSFAQFPDFRSGDLEVIAERGSAYSILTKKWTANLGTRFYPKEEFGGWQIDKHHVYDPKTLVLYKGDGSSRSSYDVNSIVTTYAGESGDPIFGNLNTPWGIEVDAEGNVIFAELQSGPVISKLAPSGEIEVIAGNGGTGNTGDGVPALETSVPNVRGIAISSKNLVYFSDHTNDVVSFVDDDGILHRFAGCLGFGCADGVGDGGPAVEATLNQPYDIDFGADGSLYIADELNYRIRRVDPNGIITTIAGTGIRGTTGDGGPAVNAQIFSPRGIAVADDGTVYFSTPVGTIRKITPQGIISTVVTFETSNAWLNHIVVGEDNILYVVNSFSYQIFKILPDGTITLFAGTGNLDEGIGDGGAAYNGEFRQPQGIAVDPDGKIYVADSSNNRIRKIGPALSLGHTFDEIIVPAKAGDTAYVFNSGGKHLRTIDVLTNAVLLTFTYTEAGYLDSVIDASGNTTQVERTLEGSPTAIVAPDGQRTELGMGVDGYLESITNPADEVHQFTYTSGGLITKITDAKGNANDYEFDVFGLLTKDTDPLGGGWELERIESEDDDGYEVSITSGEGRVGTYRVVSTSSGVRSQVNIAPDGTETTKLFEFDGGETITEADGTINYIKEGSDPRFGMLSPIVEEFSITAPSGLSYNRTLVRTVELDDASDLFSLTKQTDTVLENDRESTFVFDKAALTYTNTSPEGRITTIVEDSVGNTIKSTVVGLDDVSYSYDTRGRLTAVSMGDRTTSLVYDLDGYLQSVTDALNQVTSYEYDAVGRVTKQTSPDGRETITAYDTNGNLTSLEPPSTDEHLFEHTVRDLLKDYAPPVIDDVDNPETQYSYNLDKQLENIIRPDEHLIEFVYDATSGKQTRLEIPKGNFSFDYDAVSGQISKITSPNSDILEFTYDGFLLTNEVSSGSVVGEVEWTFNSDFLLSEIKVNGNDPIAYDYDDDSLLITAGSLTITRDVDNGLITSTSQNDLSTSQSYNNYAEMANYNASYNTTELYNVDYTQDRLGRIIQQVETIESVTRTLDYAYDLAGRLIQVKTDGVETESYQFDDNGNRTHMNGVLTATFDAQDRLLTHGDFTYTYTANGELLTKTNATNNEVTSYVYDVLGNLIEVNLPDSTKIEYVIDGRNRRVGKKVNGTLIKGWLYQDQLNPVAEFDGNNNVTARFVYGDKLNIPSFIEKNGNTYRIISDHLGSPRLIVNTATGAIEQRMDFDTWGNVTQDTNPEFQVFGFAGGLYETQTQLIRFGARDYDGNIGRWTSKDPIRFAGGDSNLYGYVLNNPINFTDPSGLIAPVFAVGIGAVVGAIAQGVTTAMNGGDIASAVVGGALLGASMTVGAMTGGAGGLLFGTGIGLGLNAIAVGGVISDAQGSELPSTNSCQ